MNFPYPPRHDILDVAIPVTGRALTATQFALVASLERDLSTSGAPANADRDTGRNYKASIAAELGHPESQAPTPSDAETGADTYRAVRATAIHDHIEPGYAPPDDTFEVDVCRYEVPGIYGIRHGETFGPNPNPQGFRLSRMTITETTRKSADGDTPSEPRWLITNDWPDVGRDAAETTRVCEPFKPNPWVQRMPDPTAPLPSQAPR